MGPIHSDSDLGFVDGLFFSEDDIIKRIRSHVKLPGSGKTLPCVQQVQPVCQ